MKRKTVKMIATSTLSVGAAYQEKDVVLSREGDGFWEDDEE